MNTTIYAAFRFLTELSLAAVIYVMHLKRRPYAGLWLFFCLPICYLICALFGSWVSGSAPFLFIRYIVLFSLVVGLIYICQDVSLRGAIFCAISAYATQHFASKIYYFFISSNGEELSIFNEVLLYIVVFSLCYSVFYFIFARRMQAHNFAHIENNELLLLTAVLLLCMIILSVLSTIYIDGGPWVASFITRFYSMVCCILILCLQYDMFKKGKLSNEMQQICQLWDLERRQLETSKETIDLINIKYHDLKHLLSTLEQRFSQEEYDTLKRKISIYDTSVKTGNEILDIVLAEKSLLCEANQVKLTCMADGAHLDFMHRGDIYSLFGNAIENAIEAVAEIEDTGKRVVSIVVRQQRGFISIHFENYYQGNLVMEQGLPITRKADRRYHGFGMKSIQMIAEKYHGTLACNAQGDIFRLDLLFPVPN